MPKVNVKICCIANIEEAELAISYGASAVGLVSEMPSGPGVITEDTILQIAQSIPDNIDSFLLTSKQDTKSIIEQLKRCKTNTVQIVDELVEGNYSDIRAELPEVKIVQVLHVNSEQSIADAIKISDHVDAILLDSGNQNLEIKELGGTGKTHDWTISKNIIQKCKVPVYLAGGLNASNVVEAVKKVNPFGVDLCSSVRTKGKLDKDKLNKFFAAINSI